MVTTRSQHKRKAAAAAASPRQAVNAGPGNQTAVTAGRSGQTVTSARPSPSPLLARLQTQTTTAAGRSGQTVASARSPLSPLLDRLETQIEGLIRLSDHLTSSVSVQTNATMIDFEPPFKRMLLAKIEKLESEKAQKEAEVQKVMEENVRLHAMLDKKEAQLQAMREQCKFMVLNHHN